jgi:ATP-dependent exoDNAse (exonuclease V) beta subunit
MNTHDLGLADAASRHTIEYRLDSTLFVEAGAGSGKTTALVSRIVQLLRSGACSLDSLAAITFTEAAALELRVRVRQSLTDLAEHGRDTLERDRAKSALGHLDEAAISTIHGFCQRLLAEHPIEARLPPRIEILDEVRQSVAWRAHWFALLDGLGQHEDMRRLFGAAALVGVTPAHLELLAREAGEEWDRCGRTGADLPVVLAAVGAAIERGTATVVSSVGRALELESLCTDPEDRLLARLRAARDLRDQLTTAGSDGATPAAEDRLAVLAGNWLSIKGANTGNKGSWSCDIDDVRGLLEEADEARQGVVSEVCDVVLPALVATFDIAAREAAAARRAAGTLVFHDLLVLARDLLLEAPAALEDVRRKVRFLLVDEFQDTDPLQLEITELIGGGRPRRPGMHAEVEAGRLFFVGDPKQSIYRFRGADLVSYEAARERLAPSGPVSLTSNFRSVPGILEFANECVSTLMGEGFSTLAAVRPAAPREASVRIAGGALPGSPSRHDQRVEESVACAAVIERAVQTDGWAVEDVAGRMRPARMSDVAILVPRRTGLDELEEALDVRGIGYRVESPSLIYRTQEVRDLLALCRAIDDPADQVALLAALRSPAFACRDDELYAFKVTGGAWSIEGRGIEVGGAGGAVTDALRVLSGYRALRFELGPVGVLEMAVRDRRLLQLAASSPRERESWRRVRFLIERARAFVDAGGGGLREFAAWVEEQLSEGLRSVESVLPEPDEDVVHILTVHAAKGLEFPITVLAGFGTTDDVPRGVLRRILRTSTGGVEVHLRVGLATSGAPALKAFETELERQEAVRVLYVAATRARDHLVVCAHHVPTLRWPTLGQRLYEAAIAAAARRPSLWQAIDQSGAPIDVECEPASTSVPPPARRSGLGHLSSAQGMLFDMSTISAAGDSVVAQRFARPASSPEDWHAWRRERDGLLARIGRRKSVRATELALLDQAFAGQWSTTERQDGATHFASGAEAGTPPRRRGRGGTQLGRAVHATLQSISLGNARQVAAGLRAPELRELAEAQASAEHIADRAGEVELLAQAALSSPTVQAALDTANPHREVYVATTIGGVVLDGYVDLCFDDAGALVVIDYKTDVVRDRAEVEAAADHYRLQAAAYALALADATGVPVHRCVLVFLSPPGRPIEVEIPHLAGVVERVRVLVAGAT